MQRTIVRIVRESILGIGVVAHCENRTTATYYLAQAAAAANTQLETVTTNHLYMIGSVNYVLEECDCLSIEDVGRLRRQHEPVSHLPVRLSAAEEHDLETRPPHYALYGSFYRWP